MQCQFGWGMQSLRRDTSVPDSLPVTAAELARIGIPARKIPRILRQLAELCRSTPALSSRRVMLRLAKSLAALLP